MPALPSAWRLRRGGRPPPGGTKGRPDSAFLLPVPRPRHACTQGPCRPRANLGYIPVSPFPSMHCTPGASAILRLRTAQKLHAMHDLRERAPKSCEWKVRLPQRRGLRLVSFCALAAKARIPKLRLLDLFESGRQSGSRWLRVPDQSCGIPLERCPPGHVLCYINPYVGRTPALGYLPWHKKGALGRDASPKGESQG